MADTRVVLGKVAKFPSLAVSDDRRGRSSDLQHIADILPLVLARYSMYETQTDITEGPMQALAHNAFPLRFDLRNRLAALRVVGHFSLWRLQVSYMAKIPSRKFPKIKKKIPSRKFPKSQRRIPSRKFAKAPVAADKK